MSTNGSCTWVTFPLSTMLVLMMIMMKALPPMKAKITFSCTMITWWLFSMKLKDCFENKPEMMVNLGGVWQKGGCTYM
jgi:hypothetical protein